MLNPLEKKILRYLIEHRDEGEFVAIKLLDERLVDVCSATKSLERKGYVKAACTLLSAAARLTPDGKYYFDMEEKSTEASTFYHVLIVTNKGEKVIETDITDIDEVFNRILIPYLQEVEFYVNGFVLEKKKITRIKIGFTDKSAKDIAAYKNKTVPPGVIMIISANDIVEFDCTKDITASLIAKAKDMIIESNKINGDHKIMDNTKVFLVHGRDNELKQEVARFITQLNIKPIILHEQPSQGMTIIEKIEAYSNVGFGIVLYTPCDVGYEKNHEKSKKGRARQNVVFEHGYLIGKLGRNRVCAVVKQEVEKPNDISGVVYVSYDENGGWKLEIAKEMRKAGYAIDLNSLI